MKKIIISVLFFLSFLNAKVIYVAAAANVSFALPELIKEFNKTYKDIEIKTVLGSSGKLTAQIKNSAPFHLFLSANMKYPNTLYKEGFAITKPVVYAKGSLAILSVKKRDFSKGIFVCLDENIKRIVIANPKTAPYGKAAKEALENAKIYEKVKDKLIFGESISQTVSYTLKAADIGFISKSALFSSKMRRFKKDVNWVEVDKRYYKPIEQGIVLLKDDKEARKFYDFLLSKKAKEIFRKYGYLVGVKK